MTLPETCHRKYSPPALTRAFAIAASAICLLLASGCAVGPTVKTTQPQVRLGNRRAQPPSLSPGRLRDLGPMRHGSVSLLLGIRDAKESRVGADVSALYNGRSRRYGHFIDPAQFQRRYGPTAADVRAVSLLVSKMGMRPSWHAGSRWLVASGDVITADRIFHTAVERFQLPGGSTFIAGRHDPIVPRTMRGLVTVVVRPSTRPALRAAVPGVGLSPTGIARAYDIQPLIRQGMEGSGQTVVFIEVDGVDRQALAAFAHRFHLPPFQYRTLGPALTAGGEATMDLEVVHAIAPKARLIVYNFAQSVISGSGIQLLSSLVSANPGAIISESIAFCERYSTVAGARAFQSAYALADLAGEAAFVSTGDSGAFGCISPADSAPTKSAVAAMLPAASPGVTAVGGTRLSVRSDGSWYNETVWEDPLETGGTGGGASRYYSRPSWQRAPGLAAQASLYGVAGARLVPDVSADADPASGMTIAFPGSGGSPSWGRGGGTSQAAPIWAAIAALIDQYLVQNHHQKIGWMNPALYSLARTPQPYAPFHDVSVGSNLEYTAANGYDLATGLGTPDAWNLARDLAHYQSSRGR